MSSDLKVGALWMGCGEWERMKINGRENGPHFGICSCGKVNIGVALNFSFPRSKRAKKMMDTNSKKWYIIKIRIFPSFFCFNMFFPSHHFIVLLNIYWIANSWHKWVPTVFPQNTNHSNNNKHHHLLFTSLTDICPGKIWKCNKNQQNSQSKALLSKLFIQYELPALIIYTASNTVINLIVAYMYRWLYWTKYTIEGPCILSPLSWNCSVSRIVFVENYHFHSCQSKFLLISYGFEVLLLEF